MAAPPEVRAASAAAGQALFQKKCVACHTVGGGDLVGPDLKGVFQRRDRAWLERWMRAPDRMLAAKDPVATQLLARYRNVPMPNQGLTQDDVADVLAYLAQASGEGGAPAGPAAGVRRQAGTPAAPPAPKGDPARGQALFTGSLPLAHGGPPCLACHQAPVATAFGGGTLGPDLTDVRNRYAPAALAAVLARPPFPAMQPIYAAHPLTADEQLDLRAFLLRPAGAAPAPADATPRLGAVAGIGAVLLLVAAHLVWRRREVVPLARAAASTGRTP